MSRDQHPGYRRDHPPRVISVEPTSAACLQASARARQPVAVTGPLNTTMAEMVYEIERGERPLGWHNLDELAALAAELDEPLGLDGNGNDR